MNKIKSVNYVGRIRTGKDGSRFLCYIFSVFGYIVNIRLFINGLKCVFLIMRVMNGPPLNVICKIETINKLSTKSLVTEYNGCV